MAKKKTDYDVHVEGVIKTPVVIKGIIQANRFLKQKIKESATVSATSVGNAVAKARRQNRWPDYGYQKGGGWKGYEVYTDIYVKNKKGIKELKRTKVA